jgi:zinc protease
MSERTFVSSAAMFSEIQGMRERGAGVKMRGMSIQWILVLFCVCAVAFAPALSAQSQQRPEEPGSQSAEPAKASGVVPPGVKLVPEMPPAGKPGKFEFPVAATKTLSNGLKIFVVTDHSETAVAVQMVMLSAGSTKDPATMPGVAQMTAALLSQGTEKRSAQQLAEAIDFVGGSLNASATKDATEVALQVVKKDLDTGLDVMSDEVLHPSFRADEIDRQRQQLLSSLQVEYSDPAYLASLVFTHVLYAGTPYGLPSEGTPGSVQKFQRDLFVKFHDANYAPNQTLIAFAGDITPDEAFAAAEKYFGAWPQANVTAATMKAPAPVRGQHIWLIDKPDAVQTQIRIGRLAIRRADPDYIPLDVTNHIFGGSYNSLLNTEVRIKSGLTYGANSTLSAHVHGGSLAVDTYTRTEQTVPAVKLVMDMLGKMSRGELTAKNLDFARDYMAGVYPIQSETAEQVAGRVLMVAMYGLPADYNRTFPDKIRAISLAQVQAEAKKYFGTENVDIVLAGNVAAFRDALKAEYTNAQYTEIPADQLDPLADDLRMAKQAKKEATPEAIAEGKQILLAAAKAAGGDALKPVATLAITETGKIHAPDGDRDLDVKWQVVYPDKSYGQVSVGGMTVQQVCDGTSSWLKFPNSVRDTTDVISEFKRGILLFGGGWGLYRQVLDGKISGPAIDGADIDGHKTQAVSLEGDFGALKLYFDATTHMLVAARYDSEAEHGVNENEQRWSDYRELNGMQFGYATVTYRNGVKFFESAIQSVEVNPKVDPALFVKPSN